MPRVSVRLYGILRHAAGSDTIVLDVPEGCTVECLLESLARASPGLARALDALEWDVVVVAAGRPLGRGDRVEGGEVNVLPPASGGGSCRCRGEVLAPGEGVDLDAVVEWLSSGDPGVGAVALFVGVVRGLNEGEEVVALDYEHHPELAPMVLERIAREVAEKHGVRGVYIAHYTGRRRPGEVTMIVAVAAGHRREAYAALEEAVERVKREAPIWKVEERKSGRVFIVGDRVIREEELRG